MPEIDEPLTNKDEKTLATELSEQELNEGFKAWAKAEVRRMTDTAAAVTDSLGLPPEKKYVVLQALYGASTKAAASRQPQPANPGAPADIDGPSTS